MKKNCFGGGEWRTTASRTIGASLAGLLVVSLASLVATPPSFEASRCEDPPDFNAFAHCFLAQYPCLPNYLGIDAAPNYSDALKCFQRNRRWPFVVLMNLNGEGTSLDPKKAESILRAASKTDPDEFGPHQIEILQKAIDRCAAGPGAGCPKLDYCKDLSVTTPDLQICDAVAQISEEQTFSRKIRETRSRLSAVESALFDQVIDEFKAYQLEDMEREYAAYAGASLGGLAGGNQAGFVRENFLKLLTETIEARRLKPAVARTLEAVNRQLERELGRNARRNTEAQQQLLNDPSAKELWDRARSDIERYRKAARESQLQWIKFRDSCATLAASLYRDRKFDPALSMKVMVTKNRIAELQSEPFAPESK
jgi:hypothetical protein